MSEITKEALEHDKAIEEKYKDNDSPVEMCLSVAAQALKVSYESTYVVMFAFVLGGYKALCSSSEIHDDHGHYVEVVYNDRKDEFYAIHYEETERMTFK